VELIWQQTRFAWIAARPEYIDQWAKPVTIKLDASLEIIYSLILRIKAVI
jgi:hypothetical protein